MTTATLETRPTAATTTTTHAHHWLIEEPHGAESGATCKTCGASRTFRNWLAEGDFLTNEEQRVLAA